MIHFSDYELEQYINEDIPYLDLTTHLQDIQNKQASLEIITREDVLVSCMEESCRIVKLLGCDVDFYIPSKQQAKKGDILLRFSGDYNDVHKAWRSAQVVLEYSCKIATYTHNMKNLFVFIFTSIMLLLPINSFGQEESKIVEKGEFYGDLFLGANFNLKNNQMSYRFNRLHFAYKHNFSEKLYFNGMIESAKEDYALSGSYNGITNLFEFCLGYQSEKLDAKFGLIGTELNQMQEKLWRNRNIDK